MIFVLKQIPILKKLVDERFVNHRLRSGCYGGMAGGLLSCALFEYRRWVNHIESWDLFAVAVTIAGVGLALMIWYLIID